MATAYYRNLSNNRDRLYYLLLDLGIKRSIVAQEFSMSRDQIKRFVLSKGKIREKRGRPKELTPSEEVAVKTELRKRQASLNSAERRDLIQIVTSPLLNIYHIFN